MEFKALENEIWVDAKSFTTDYSGHYIVSNMGRCWSFKRNKFIGKLHNEHWYVGLSKNNKPEVLMIGRLMLISFGIPIPEHLKDLPTSKLHCMHLDGDSTNNNLSNFAWGDNRENQNEINAKIKQIVSHLGENNHFYGKHHTKEAKNKISKSRKGKISKDCPNSKPIMQYSKDGTFIRDWNCTMDVYRELGINQSHISACAIGKRKTCGGYIWKYKEEAV